MEGEATGGIWGIRAITFRNYVAYWTARQSYQQNIWIKPDPAVGNMISKTLQFVPQDEIK